MNRGSSNRGARGAAINTRGSTFRGRGRGAPRGGSSSKFPNYSETDRSVESTAMAAWLDPTAWDPEYARRKREAELKACFQDGPFDTKRRSILFTGSTPEPQPSKDRKSVV